MKIVSPEETSQVWRKKEMQSGRSSENIACSNVGIYLSAANQQTETDLCDVAVSCWARKILF